MNCILTFKESKSRRKLWQKLLKFGFKKMNLQTLEAYTNVENQKSSKLLEKLSFERTGVNDGKTGEIIYKLTNQLE